MRAARLTAPGGGLGDGTVEPLLDRLLAALPRDGRFCLDGAGSHPSGRWTFLGARPREVRRVEFGATDPLAIFDGLHRAEARSSAELLPGLRARDVPRWVGFVSYDAAWSDPNRSGLRAPIQLPRDQTPAAWFARYEVLIALDERTGEAWLLSANTGASERLRSRIHDALARHDPPSPATVGPAAAEPETDHRRRIERALEAIARGDLYQVNLARSWRAPYAGCPLALRSAMRAASPVPFGAYLELPQRTIIGRSMERFLRWDPVTCELSTCPIKGTIADSGDRRADTAALHADPKERAEHSMIVDLMRNDLARVAALGTVRVQEPLRVEPFAGLSHLVSTVICETREGVGPRQILEATFPPGSVTGTPKLAAMEHIERAERGARGVYTGAIGYVDRAGGLSLAVLIRVAVIAERQALYCAGGGLVSASDVTREVAETELKARVFLQAIEAVRHNKFV